MSEKTSRTLMYVAIVLFLFAGLLIGSRLGSNLTGSQALTTVEVTETVTRVGTATRNATLTAPT